MHSFFVSASVAGLKFQHRAGNGSINFHSCPSRICLKTSHLKIFPSTSPGFYVVFSRDTTNVVTLPKENVNGKTANDIKRTNLMSITLINSIISDNIVKWHREIFKSLKQVLPRKERKIAEITDLGIKEI